MRKIIVMDARTIVIGRAGENAAAQVVWPGILAKWRGLYGEGTVQLAARRPGDKEPYPAVCETDGDDVTWVVSAGDTGRAGIGECELSYLVGDTVAKSQTWATMVMKSLTGDGTAEPPEEPAKAWFTAIQSQIGDLADLTTKAKENLVAAINEAAKTGSGGAGSISMRTADGYIQYSTDNGERWENLVALADLKGPQADWEEQNEDADGYIRNKPDIPAPREAVADCEGAAAMINGTTYYGYVMGVNATGLSFATLSEQVEQAFKTKDVFVNAAGDAKSRVIAYRLTEGGTSPMRHAILQVCYHYYDTAKSQWVLGSSYDRIMHSLYDVSTGTSTSTASTSTSTGTSTGTGTSTSTSTGTST